jgi:hypothetical protein
MMPGQCGACRDRTERQPSVRAVTRLERRLFREGSHRRTLPDAVPKGVPSRRSGRLVDARLGYVPHPRRLCGVPSPAEKHVDEAGRRSQYRVGNPPDPLWADHAGREELVFGRVDRQEHIALERPETDAEGGTQQQRTRTATPATSSALTGSSGGGRKRPPARASLFTRASRGGLTVAGKGAGRRGRRSDRESERQQRFAGAVEAASLEDARVNQSAEPAVATEWIDVVVEAANGREDPAVVEIPFLDLVVWPFDVGAEAAEIFAEPLLDAVEPGVFTDTPAPISSPVSSKPLITQVSTPTVPYVGSPAPGSASGSGCRSRAPAARRPAVPSAPPPPTGRRG